MKISHCFLLLSTLFLASLSSLVYSDDTELDFFYINLKWPKSQCQSKEGCCLPKKGNPSLNDFVILSFQGPDSNCPNGTKFQTSKIADLVPSLREYWPSLSCPSRKSSKLWEEEWNTYGTCGEAVINQHDYFAAAVKAFKQINLLKLLGDAGIIPNGTYYPGGLINDAIAKAGLGEITVTCREDEKGVNAVLDYISLCASNKGNKIKCPGQSFWICDGANGNKVKFTA